MRERTPMQDFHNRLRILQSIDSGELQRDGVDLDTREWISFMSNPFKWFIRASDEDAAKLWAIIEGRM